MSLRWKLALTMGMLLLTMVTLVSVSAYLTTDRRLHEEVDTSLNERAEALRLLVNRLPPGRTRPRGAPVGQPVEVVLPPNANLAQLLDANGNPIETVGVALPVNAEERRIATHGARPSLRTVTVDGELYRVETVPLRSGGAVQVARELAPTDDTLASLRRRYAASSGLVALLGAILGWLLASWLTRPVIRLTAAAEHVAATGQLDADIETHGKDETARLSQAFASMLSALRDSRARQRQLVQDASHELRTPVTSIRTNVDVLRRHPYLDASERTKVLDDVNTELTQVTAMVEELVVLATGDGEPDDGEGPVRLDDIVRDAADRARRRTSRQVSVDAEPTTVLGSTRGLDRAVSNLVDNACKFSPAGTPIQITLTGGRLQVRDFGQGIATEDLPHVFDRFYRATTARTEPGSGLGLAIVEQIVQSHGGRAFAENHRDGGAVVGFEVPVVGYGT